MGNQAVVPRLAGGIVLDAPVGRIPRACIAGVRDIPRGERAAGDREIARDRLARDPAHYVDPEFETEAMRRSGKRGKAGIAAVLYRRGEAHGIGDVAPVCIDHIMQLLGRPAVLRVGHKPALVDHGVGPAERFQRLR